MAVVAMYEGGIVNNRKVAQRLAMIILGGAKEPSNNRLVNVEDRGDRWFINGSLSTPSTGNDGYNVELRKRDAMVLTANPPFRGNVLDGPLIVKEFAEAIIENRGGVAEVKRQSPLAVHDKGDIWLVRGSGNAHHAIEGPGPFELQVRKEDAQVIDVWTAWILKTPPEVQELLRPNRPRCGARPPD